MKILIADDDEITRVTLKALLSARGYDVVTAQDGMQAYDLLRRDDAPVLAILDWMMPGLEGIEVCRKLRESGKPSYTYIIMLSSRGEKHDFAAGMQAGADDYLVKPCDIDELHLRVRAGERIVTLQERLRTDARMDALTGVLNRGAVIEILSREIAHAARDDAPLSVILADLDGFKQVNDTHGHPVGDAVLRHVAGLLGAPLRAYDVLGRYGGEEFLLVLPGCGTAGALELAERVRHSVADAPVSTSAGPVSMTVSLGVASRQPATMRSEDLILAADEALYCAKRGGRNRVEAGTG